MKANLNLDERLGGLGIELSEIFGFSISEISSGELDFSDLTEVDSTFSISRSDIFKNVIFLIFVD